MAARHEAAGCRRKLPSLGSDAPQRPVRALAARRPVPDTDTGEPFSGRACPVVGFTPCRKRLQHSELRCLAIEFPIGVHRTAEDLALDGEALEQRARPARRNRIARRACNLDGSLLIELFGLSRCRPQCPLAVEFPLMLHSGARRLAWQAFDLVACAARRWWPDWPAARSASARPPRMGRRRSAAAPASARTARGSARPAVRRCSTWCRSAARRRAGAPAACTRRAASGRGSGGMQTFR